MEILKYFCNMNIKNKINNMDDAKREKLGEVIRFGIVGGLATVLQYVIYLAMMPALAHFIPNMGDHSLATTANTIAYIVSALVVAANDGQAVSIWVSSNHEVSVQLGTELHTESHSLCILWVWRNDCWEVAIYNHLLRNYIDILEAPRTQTERYDDTTCTVHR